VEIPGKEFGSVPPFDLGRTLVPFYWTFTRSFGLAPNASYCCYVSEQERRTVDHEGSPSIDTETE